MDYDPAKILTIHYTNHRGESGMRRIVPSAIRFGRTEWHTREQYLIDAFDVDKQAMRTFAVAEITAFGDSGIERRQDKNPEA
jgi:predicted DNA-binding transcriptional regulator YafY